MDLREAIERYKQFKIPSLSVICENAGQYSKTCLLTIIILFFIFLYLIQQVPHWQVAQFGMTNPKDLAEMENSYRATLAQMLGGIAVGIGIYFAWGNLTTAREGQITERFTRAVDQLGSKELEIRLGGIYALERIANESEKDHWPIMEILTAYVRLHSGIEGSSNEETHMIESAPSDIQAIFTVLGRRKYTYKNEETRSLNLSKIYLNGVELIEANLKGTNFSSSNLEGANFEKANLEEANLGNVHCNCRTNLKLAHLERTNLRWAHFEGTYLNEAHFEGANLDNTDFTGARLRFTHFEKTVHKRGHFVMADLEDAYLEEANLTVAILEGTNLKRAHLEGANLTGAFFNSWTKFEEAHLDGANLTGAILEEAHLEGANLTGAILEKTDFTKANLKGAFGLSLDQLSKVKTLYNAELHKDLEIPLRKKYPSLFEEPKGEL